MSHNSPGTKSEVRVLFMCWIVQVFCNEKLVTHVSTLKYYFHSSIEPTSTTQRVYSVAKSFQILLIRRRLQYSYLIKSFSVYVRRIFFTWSKNFPRWEKSIVIFNTFPRETVTIQDSLLIFLAFVVHFYHLR